MKKYPKIVQCDKRGQIVIPKDVRRDLKIDEGTGFWMYTVTDEGILLKKIDAPEMGKHKEIIEKISEKASKINVKKENIKKSVSNYRKKHSGNLEVI